MRRRVLCGLLLALLLTGCAGQELTNVTLIQTIGVDGEGPVVLTAVGEETEGRRVYTSVGADVTAAQEGLKGVGTTRLEVTHAAQLVLGPEVDVARSLWQEVTHRKSGCGATVWLAGNGSAASLLSGAEDPGGRLRSLEENAGVKAPTLLEALSALRREGQVALPVVALEGEELQVVGMRTVKEGDHG